MIVNAMSCMIIKYLFLMLSPFTLLTSHIYVSYADTGLLSCHLVSQGLIDNVIDIGGGNKVIEIIDHEL